MARIISAVVVLLLAFSLQAQQHFVQFIVMGVQTDQQCREIEAAVLNHPGFSSVRVEAHQSNFLAIFNPSQSYTEADFTSWLQALGYSIYCFHNGIVGVHKMERLTAELCEQRNQRKAE